MQENVAFDSGGLTLSGLFHIPEGYDGTPLPAFIVRHGCAGSRDESHARVRAGMMQEFGYVALRFDFRCCGESERERAQTRCMDQVADAKNALTFLARRPEVDPKRIGVAGHSFGAAVSVQTAGVDERAACRLASCGWGDGERKFRGRRPMEESRRKVVRILDEGRARKKATGESAWTSRFDAAPIPPALRENLSPKAIKEIPTENRLVDAQFPRRRRGGEHRPAPAAAVPHRERHHHAHHRIRADVGEGRLSQRADAGRRRRACPARPRRRAARQGDDEGLARHVVSDAARRLIDP